ncbi:MAG: 16S rRNA (uracil(1498)-N(3))-methyltransferase [Hyphomicrobiales bacterium]
MLLFYTPDIDNGIYALNQEESKHCYKVLRLKEGDRIHLTNGEGNLYEAKIIEALPKKCTVEVIKILTDYEKRDFKVSIAVAPTKNIDRIEWFLEKATEIGIDEVFPVLCKQSERKVIKLERLNRVVTSAMKQSLKAYHPVVHDLHKFEEIVKSDIKGQKFIAYCSDEYERKSLKSLIKPKEDVFVMIGPEGDFRSEEVKLAIENGFIPVTLGNSRLRTETAALVAVHTVNIMNEE